MKTQLTLLLAFALLAPAAQAKLSVLTTTTDLRALAAEIGGPDVSAESICKGTQDPHFIEAKPSFMTKAANADLLLTVGLDLEVGWLPSIQRGSRNPRIGDGGAGYLELGPALQEPYGALEVPTGKLTRAEGDVHPYGNPHFTLDPLRFAKSGKRLAEKLAELDPAHASDYRKRADALVTRLEGKVKAWQARIDRSGVKQVVTYHKTLTYFLDRFKLGNPAILEPKPGIPPTSGHILEVIALIKSQKIPLVLVENYFDPTVTKRIVADVLGLRAVTVPVSVDGAPDIATASQPMDALYEKLVATVEAK